MHPIRAVRDQRLRELLRVTRRGSGTLIPRALDAGTLPLLGSSIVDDAATLGGSLVPSTVHRLHELTVDPTPGFYAWWVTDEGLGHFRPSVPASNPPGCPDGWSLLYVGISPDSPGSAENLATRVAFHATGRANRSTFRYTLAALLPSLGLTVAGVTPNGKKPVFGDEAELTHWIDAHCGVTVAPHPAPWSTGLERLVIRLLNPPLNGTHSLHPFKSLVAARRAELLAHARLTVSGPDAK